MDLKFHGSFNVHSFLAFVISTLVKARFVNIVEIAQKDVYSTRLLLCMWDRLFKHKHLLQECCKSWVEAHMYSFMMGESSGSSNCMTLAIETNSDLASYVSQICFEPRGRSMERASPIISIEEIIENSKSHWSQLGDFDSKNEVAEMSNMEVFKTLQAHSTWGSFFFTFGEGEGSSGELVMGEKIAEGGQAKIYDVQVKWYDPINCESDLKDGTKHILKVFKKGTFLRNLQSQWPQGMLQQHAIQYNCCELGLPLGVRFHCEVLCGTLLEDGRFAFLMTKEKEDLRNVITRRMLTRSNIEGPFSNEEALEAMFEVAFGMNQLHEHGIVLRDIKASNVLVSQNGNCHVADFECSIGIVGTGFWRAPEILEACKHRNVSMKPELFTKAVDVYSYGMTCFEILTGKLPFEGHVWNDYDLVLQGQRPQVPSYVDGWIRQLLDRCWQSNPVDRPTSEEILQILVAKSSTCRNRDLQIRKEEVKRGVRKPLDYNTPKIEKMWRSLWLKLRLPKLKKLSLCRK